MADTADTSIYQDAANFLRIQSRVIAVRDALIQAVVRESHCSARDPEWVALIVRALVTDVQGVNVSVASAFCHRDGSKDPEQVSALARFDDGETIRVRIDVKAAGLQYTPDGNSVAYILNEDGGIEENWADYWVLRLPDRVPMHHGVAW